MFAWLMTHPRIYDRAWAGACDGAGPRLPVPKIGPVRAWTSQRDLPPMPAKLPRIWSRR